jgi:mitochondrial fission protein ELM1
LLIKSKAGIGGPLFLKCFHLIDMAIKTGLPISSCWVVTEGLIGLQNQAIGLAQALGLPYVLKEVKKSKGFWQLFSSGKHGLTPPWPDLLISCGRQSVSSSVAVRRASEYKTFTVHIQDPLTDPKQFDVVIVPAHDKVRGENVFVTQGAIHHVSPEKLISAAGHFRPLLASLPRPLISVLIGGKNRHQSFSAALAHDFAGKLRLAATNTGGGLAISFSRRTGAGNETIIRQDLKGYPSYIWDGTGENPYLGLLALADAIVVTSDSISMVSEACSAGKPVYIYELPNGGKRHKRFCESLIKSGTVRPFSGTIEIWKNTALDETRRAANFVYEHFMAKVPELKLNVVH